MAVDFESQKIDLPDQSLPQSIFEIPDAVSRLSEAQREAFNKIFNYQFRSTPMCYATKEAQECVAKLFKTDLGNVLQRRTLIMTNSVWGEQTLFNPLRSNRPLQAPDQTILKEGEKNMMEHAMNILEGEKGNSSANCSFCHPLERTPQDDFGSLTQGSCLTLANAGSYDGIHSLVVPQFTHNPAYLSEETFVDMMSLANKWFAKAATHYKDCSARFPFLGWNVGPRAGASLFHPHLQVMVAQQEPYLEVETLRERMAFHQVTNGGYPYLNTLAFALKGLGLSFKEGDINTVFNLVPLKEKEVIVFQNDGSTLPSEEFSRAIFKVIEWWRDGLGVTNFNMSIFLPAFRENLDRGPWYGFYPFARLVDRGVGGVCDIGVMELNKMPVVAADPCVLAKSYSQFHGLN